MPSEENQNNDSEDSSKPKKRAVKKSPGRPKKKQDRDWETPSNVLK